jgi:paraquat-inducible protein A
VDFIGKWSMLDVFLIALLTSIVKLGNIAEVNPGPGITFFALVVILTLFAAQTFDPRIIWDNKP